jgi:hypothetical protein
MFLPTMPQDDLEDIKEALLAARQANAGENPVFYRKLNTNFFDIILLSLKSFSFL